MSKVKKGAGVTAPAAGRARLAAAEEAARPVTGKTGGTPRSAPRKPVKAAKAPPAKRSTRARPAPAKGKPAKGGRTARKAAPRAVRAPDKPTKAKGGRKAVSKVPAKRGKRPAGRTVAKGKRPLVKQPDPPRSVKIRELDPVQKCGPGTSVQFLYRVDELLGGAPTSAHLVFFDRHGWYCEHGRNCPAVADVRKHGKMHHLFGD